MNEKYIPLYRKYRPQKLDEIVGQEHVKKALTNAINLDKIAHAYLFTGPRGTGKTSTARILAKSLNCEKGPTINPCGKCASCVDITNSTPIDVIEIDAASNRSVNDAQNILEKIQYAPVNGKYKIYIIDEVHMLTVQAFNALLKTLEEPPKNVIFILATTEVHKVLDTIKSRCQRFDFKRITTEDIINHLKKIAKLENINIEDDAIATIAKNAAGGMRDSLALLDQLSVLDTQKAITTEDINSLLGRLSFDTLHKLSQCIIKSDANSAIEVLEDVYNSGNEPSQILLNLLNYFKNLLVVKNCKSEIVMDLTQTTESQLELMQGQTKELETQQIVFLIERTSHYINELKTTTNPHIWLEVAMIDLSNLTENTKLMDLQSRLQKLESGEPVSVSVSAYKTPPMPVQKPSMRPAGAGVNPPIVKTVSSDIINSSKPSNNVELPTEKVEIQKVEKVENEVKYQTSQSEDFSPVPMGTTNTASNNIAELWKSLLNNISSVPTKQLLLQLANPVEITPESVVITMKNESFIRQLNDSGKKQTLIEAVDKLFGQTNSNVTVRLPQASDAQVKVHSATIEEKPANLVQKEVTVQKQELQENLQEKVSKPESEKSDSESKNVDEEDSSMVELKPDNLENTAITGKKEEQTLSDQVKMVKDLFDGKIVE
ncbi:MAG: DNA polymerase III subunit gamma/tau [Candidatus Gastranaerophilaceae bacterium]